MCARSSRMVGKEGRSVAMNCQQHCSRKYLEDGNVVDSQLVLIKCNSKVGIIQINGI